MGAGSTAASRARRAVAAPPFGPGTVLAGRFTLDDLIGDTDGARFWRATDRTLARNVAVHVVAEGDERAASLLTAARTSALVTDGHLLRVLDAAREDGVVYVVNEWGSGVSLDRLLEEGPLSPRRAAWVVKEVAEAIATAHRNGVAHGRLLPENVMVTEAGSVKLIGFVMDAVLRSNGGRDQRRVTGGEPMSAHESDVVNLAALLYAALVGRWPGSEGSHVPPAPTEHGRPLRPRRVRAGVPRPLDAVCERVLNAGVHPHHLPLETAHEIYAALSDYIGDPAGTAQVGYEATTVLETDDLVAGSGEDPPDTGLRDTGLRDTGAITDTGDLPATGALPVPTPGGADGGARDEPAYEPWAGRPDAGGRTSGGEHQEEPPDVPPSVPPGEAAEAPPGTGTGDGRTPTAGPVAPGDPESTQAGAPVFFEEDTGVGWLSAPARRGLPGTDEGGGWGSSQNHRPTP